MKVCYGRPSLRGRQMLGTEHVPYGKLWRTGANEPTIFYTPVALQVAGIRVPPGVYSLYTVPGKTEWEVIVNRSITQWGHETQLHRLGEGAGGRTREGAGAGDRRADRDLHHPGGAGRERERVPHPRVGEDPGQDSGQGRVSRANEFGDRR